jgi:hypothetical protein
MENLSKAGAAEEELLLLKIRVVDDPGFREWFRERAREMGGREREFLVQATKKVMSLVA